MHLFIATPCYGGIVTKDFMLSMLTLNNALVKAGIPFTFATLGNESLITRARNLLVARFLSEAEATHLLFIDADIKFPPEAVLRLLSHGGPVVATACPKKTIAWDAALAAAPACESPEDLLAASVEFAAAVSPPGELFPGEEIERKTRNGFVRTAYAGTGMMLVAREVFDVLAKEFPESAYDDPDGFAGPEAAPHLHGFFDTLIHPGTRNYLSEDYAFCHRWRSCGGEVWLDVESSVSHEGTYVFEGDAARRLALERRRSGPA